LFCFIELFIHGVCKCIANFVHVTFILKIFDDATICKLQPDKVGAYANRHKYVDLLACKSTNHGKCRNISAMDFCETLAEPSRAALYILVVIMWYMILSTSITTFVMNVQ